MLIADQREVLPHRLFPDACFVVGVTKLDQYPAFVLEEFREALAAKGHIIPMFCLDPPVASQVEFLAKALLTVGYSRDSQSVPR
ncbi:hypothetical protein [Xanthomonas phaseoli]|uniref:hypothetical protein n=1 Tax=Xanthomonas phaseoli TaxID=1985254 RepID=UPI001237CD61|nr:hypothetical protein [Xanthomonas phaseoli]MBO9832584.1 hypothetical protein [Xanthomonas phaseoli pv. dieffenbachiae]MBO9838394.1 hypothetical protein [Xanthomonas phaseoli pv. dieffenbachiae]MBO9839441.1 hypothetical protein [Xanthomonas phaseoli pv. dieffenbachiae]MBO9861464.1 hypothetical protein [Xanthomonas phaseoli pv. dieffenbachiae]MBO9864275.1 hypothetical protein [Xanthomonas phaseoli pv. dieffenbachiae]